MTQRNEAAPIIAKIIAEVGITDEKLLRKRLKEAYPFGTRAYHPYKIWRDEIKRQLARKGIFSPQMKAIQYKKRSEIGELIGLDGD